MYRYRRGLYIPLMKYNILARMKPSKAKYEVKSAGAIPFQTQELPEQIIMELQRL